MPITARDGSRRCLVTGAFSALLALCVPATAQPPANTPAAGAVEFDEEPFRIDSIGLSMLLPLGCKAEGGTAGAKSAMTISSPDNTWFCNVQNPRLNVADRSAKDFLKNVMTQVLKQSGEIYIREKPGDAVAFKGEIIEGQHTVMIGPVAAERAYLKLPGQGSNPPFIRGYTIFQISSSQFATFELVTTEPLFATAKRDYETMVGTAKFEDPAQVNADRAAAIKTGLKVFERVDEAALRSLIQDQPERWERLYRPSPTGARADDEEIGYRRIRMGIGKRGDLDPSRKNPSAADRQAGFVIRMDARLLDRAGAGKTGFRTVDSQAVYFMTFDRNEEAWNVQNAIREGKSSPAIFSEIGGRVAKTMSVEIRTAGASPKSIHPIIQGDGYINRLESLLLPQILIRSGISADCAFYAYQSEKETIRLRRDFLEQPSDRPGMWRLSTRLGDTAVPQVSIYNANGRLIRTELPKGIITEPISLQELASIWKGKNLPMD
ncbi:hypothetical protein PHYC_01421 [Phycisphaerales bacterium]|nr:hypothetical protein PHYC_01421 [Phycisphaerales bacterium]